MRPINRWCYGCKRHVGNKQNHRTGCSYIEQLAQGWGVNVPRTKP